MRTAAPVREQAVTILRAAVANGRFKWGDRLLERELCSLLATSRTTVREALRQLEVEGLVTVIPGKGPVVAHVTPDDARALYEVRAALEGLAAKLFTENAGGSEIAALDTAFRRFEDASRTKSVDAMVAAKDEFYGILFRGAANPVLETVVATIYARVRQLRFASLSEQDRPTVSAKELRRALSAIKRRDGVAAQQRFIEHVERAATVAIRGISPREEPLANDREH